MSEEAAEADRRLRAKFQKTLDLGDTCHGMWAFRKPHTIRFGFLSMGMVGKDAWPWSLLAKLKEKYCLNSGVYIVTTMK